MKKRILILVALMLIFSFTACSEKSEKSQVEDETIQITEKMYLTWINEIYTNPMKYIGKKVSIEGMFSTEKFEGSTYYYVYRVGPGCCGNDGSMCGFEFTTAQELPKENDWISVDGTLEQYKLDGATYLKLSDCSIKALKERGKETIMQ